MKVFSINNYVKVKLNSSGVEIMNQKKNVINFPEPDMVEIVMLNILD